MADRDLYRTPPRQRELKGEPRDCLSLSSSREDATNETVHIRKSAARLSVFLRNISAFGCDEKQNSSTDSGASNPSPSNNLNKVEGYSVPFSVSALRLIKTFLEFHETVPVQVLPKPLPPHGLGADGMLQLNIASHDVDLVFGLKGRDLFELMEAADYMQIEALCELVSCRVAWEWKQQSLEDLESIAVLENLNVSDISMISACSPYDKPARDVEKEIAELERIRADREQSAGSSFLRHQANSGARIEPPLRDVELPTDFSFED